MDSQKVMNEWFNSWLIQNEDNAIKETDISVFNHHGSGIPKEIWWFFDADKLSKGEKINVILNYLGNGYEAYITRMDEPLGRIRILWHSDLDKKMNEYYETVSSFPFLYFHKETNSAFSIRFENELKLIMDPLDDSHTDEEKAAHALIMDETSLKAAAKSRSKDKPSTRLVKTEQYVRDPYIAQYSKRRAKGICQLCGEPAPFNDSNGNPYLESHHVIWISKGGPDSIDNTVALCPNCHRKMHVVASKTDIDALSRWLDEKLDKY